MQGSSKIVVQARKRARLRTLRHAKEMKGKRTLRRFVAVVALLMLCSATHPAQDRITDLEPTIILISIDGFRWDYPEKFAPPTINSLIAGGTRAKWLIPAYPTKTFPNHYTIVTGLHPGTHGLVDNNMLDRKTGRVFGLGKAEEVTDAMWWGGEPIWNTAQKQGKISASFFWPGSEAPIGGMRPRYFKPYVHETPHEVRVDTVLSWLDLPKAERPQFITTYFSDVDDVGHNFGPDAEETRAAVMKVDSSLKRLMDGLKARGIDRAVNVLVVSDHGMSPYTNRNSVILDDLFNSADTERIFWSREFTQIYPKPGKEDEIYRTLKARLPKDINVYRSSQFPARWRLKASNRIAPIVVVPNENRVITSRERYERYERDGNLDKPGGGHGFDNETVNMRAVFIGHGERFRPGRVVGPFSNVDLYNVMCRILNIEPAPNEGKKSTVRKLLR
jgi:predicted AlkP superfamily pyrophosphatase or phosphodiesterase